LLIEGTELYNHLTQALCIVQDGSVEGENMEGLELHRRKKSRSTQ